jgi:signal transduction histidine kinase
MKPLRSLRARLLLGSILWTVGLLFFAHMLSVALLHHFADYHRGPAQRVWNVVFPRQGHFSAHWTVFALVCLAAGLWQIRAGMKPFHSLRERLGALRDGAETRVDGRYPSEVQPLVNDLNALLDHREGVVRRAMATAGDLAHGLKTPLAVLSNEADRLAADGHAELAGTIAQQVALMKRQVEYHLAHARAAASGARLAARCAVRESAEGLARTLQRLHAARKLTIDVEVPPAHGVRVRREDLDEMLGNLLDNACKWAAHRVVITSAAHDSSMAITVDDDGPGIPERLRDAVLQRGVRADEAAPGSGLGLSIVRDLAELHGGSIGLETSPLGGTRARLHLPSAG